MRELLAVDFGVVAYVYRKRLWIDPNLNEPFGHVRIRVLLHSPLPEFSADLSI